MTVFVFHSGWNVEKQGKTSPFSPSLTSFLSGNDAFWIIKQSAF